MPDFHLGKTIPFSTPVSWDSGQMGCYGIMNSKRQMIYIGKSIDLKARVTSHVSMQNDVDAEIYTYAPALVVGLVFQTEKEMDAQEKSLILAYSPPCNSQVG